MNKLFTMILVLGIGGAAEASILNDAPGQPINPVKFFQERTLLTPNTLDFAQGAILYVACVQGILVATHTQQALNEQNLSGCLSFAEQAIAQANQGK